MKITLPLSLLLCLPAMAMAADNAPLLLRGALQDQAVDADAEALQRKLKETPSTKSTKKDRRRLSSAKPSKTATDKGKYYGFEVEEAVNAGPGQRKLAKSTKSNSDSEDEKRI
mmetsp:Transcript_29963/g.45335  ORF Transcript_29963/g.45335 Transcript_29963/m.45335 type:complete len:113 (-) Transcript_29963:288-626(-)